MKKLIKEIIILAESKANQEGLLPFCNSTEIKIEETKNFLHGDFSTNLAMKTAKIQKMAPVKIASIIVDKIEDTHNILDKAEVAKPGFINFFIKPSAWKSVLNTIHREDSSYGHCNIGSGKRVQVEFVSSNPTGPLHIGHGRGAAIGNSIANLLSACGFEVQKEYYINDSGKQISTLGLSVYLRIKEIMKYAIVFPKHCYQGNYIKNIAKNFIKDEYISSFFDDEENSIKKCAKYASKKIVNQIAQDLEEFGIKFDCWFSEQSLYESNEVDETIYYYRQKGLVYQKNGAHWFNTSKFGDEKDRVIIRKNGATTYFASDIAYHKNKYTRGFDLVIDIWGADHHGYVPRMQAAVEAMGKNKKQFKVVLVKLVNLLRDGNPVAMSTRSGDFVTLKDVISEVGGDSAKFMFLSRSYDSPLDFDIELAKKKNNDNPVFYVQYVHARISNILNKNQTRAASLLNWNKLDLKHIENPEEIQLMKKLSSYPEIIKKACQLMEPHRLAFYLMELSSNFHTYYNKRRILTNDSPSTRGRIYLILAVKKVIRNGLKILGVNAPEKM